MHTVRTLLAGLLALALAGCTYLPESGPSRFSIDRGASEKIEIDRRAVVMDYVMVDVSQQVSAAHVPRVGPELLYNSFGTGKGGIPDIRIGIGDANRPDHDIRSFEWGPVLHLRRHYPSTRQFRHAAAAERGPCRQHHRSFPGSGSCLGP